MRILLVGGGSGGHVTPLRSVADEIVEVQKNAEFELITDHKYRRPAAEIFSGASYRVNAHSIFAGKLRRYGHKPWWWHFIHLPTLLLNIRDIFYLLIGFCQSLRLLSKLNVDVVFCKGGFVCLPVGIAAHIYKIPLVLHDTDTVPGLTNRILARWARAIAVGTKAENYDYPDELIYETGVPISSEFKSVTPATQAKVKQKLGLDPNRKLLLVSGGGTGARNLNKIVASQARKLTDHFQIVHLCGPGKSREVEELLDSMILSPQQKEDYRVIDFTTKIALYFQAADVIVSRAGGTTIQEIAAVGKPLVLVPGLQLSGGHQLKNAQSLQDENAAIVFDERVLTDNSELLTKAVLDLDSSPDTPVMIKNLRKFFNPKAAHDVAAVILSVASHHHMKQKINQVNS